MKPSGFLLALSIIVLSGAFDASAQAIIQITSSDAVSFFVKSDGSLWRGDFAHKMARWRELMDHARLELKQHPQSNQARSQMRELGSHLTSDNFEPVDLIVSNGVTTVAMNGQRDTFFIKDDGSLWAMGNNQGGYLGDGTFDTPEQPVQIVPSGVKAVACGETFTIFLKDDGSVWGFGWSGDGELGIKDDFVTRPKKIVAGEVVAIAAGYLHSLFIKNDGSLWGMGNNGYGQLGLGTNLNHTLRPVQIVASNVASVAAGARHTLLIKNDGSLWAVGENGFGKLGDCTIDWAYHPKRIVSNDVIAVTAGYDGSLFLKKDGSLWGMGINWGSDYGEGIEFNSHCPTQIFGANNPALVANCYYNAQLKTCASIWAGKFNNNQAGADSANNKSGGRSTVAGFTGSNLITIELMKDGNIRLTYSGNAGINYALERSSSLSNPNWVSLVTNKAPSGGVLVITNTPDTTMNNFWRIRSVP